MTSLFSLRCKITSIIAEKSGLLDIINVKLVLSINIISR